jgi:integrase/recombinase XerD
MTVNTNSHKFLSRKATMRSDLVKRSHRSVIVPAVRPIHRIDAWRMIKRRARIAGLPETIGNHTFRATGITAFRKSCGSIEHAQQTANHASPQTTPLYDRSSDEITLDEVERIAI